MLTHADSVLGAVKSVQNSPKAFRVQYVNKLKEAPCTDCHEIYPPHVMDFDHVRLGKVASISTLVRNGPFEALQRELQKCELVCSNCHRVRTQGRGKPSKQAFHVTGAQTLRLTDTNIRALAYQETGRNIYWDSSLSGFGVRVGKNFKTFVFLVGSGRRKKIGRYPFLTLAAARIKAQVMLTEKVLGHETPTRKAFPDVVETYLKDCEPRIK